MPARHRWGIALAAILLAGYPARGADYSWVAFSPDYYTNSAAWSPTGVPGLANTAVIDNGGTALYTTEMTNGLTGLTLGDTGGSGTITMSGGELDITNTGGTALIMGNALGSVGTIEMNGGVLTIARPSTSSRYFQDSFQPGYAAGGVGNFTLNDGWVNVLCGLEAGINGDGTVTVNGGTMMANGWFTFGRGGSTGSGTFNLSGGTVYVLNNGGVGTGAGLRLQYNAGTTGIANISGGTLYCRRISLGNNGKAGTATLNVSGGNIYLGEGGIVCANNNAGQVKSINVSGGTFRTVNMDPNTSGQLGLSSILTGGTNWTWNSANLPTINLTNDPGPGIVTFAPEAGCTITLNDPFAGPGALVINGPGTVAFGGANTYTGGTTLSQGTLALNNGGSFVDSTLNLPSGTTLDFNASDVEYFTNNLTGNGDVLVTMGGNGYEIVTGNLSYSGSTTIRGGTLVVDTTLDNTSDVLVTNTGTLAGEGQIGAPILVASTNSDRAVHLRMGTSPLNIPGTLTVSNVTLGAGSEMDVKLGTAMTVGGGVNDLLVVRGDLTIDPNAFLNVVPLEPLGGTYVIATYTGTLTGQFTNTVGGLTRYSFSIDYGTPGQIKLTVSGSNAGLVWYGATNDVAVNNWDVLTTPNWVNGAASDTFYEGDAVTFDDTATNFNVQLASTLYPASITFNANSNYSVTGTGSGRITGGTGITKNGDGTLLMASGLGLGNDFTGPVQVNGGIFKMNGVNSLGATNGGTTVANGATLDINGRYPGGEPLVLQGAGFDGTNGALMNSGANLSGPGLPNVTLAGDTLINTPSRLDFGNHSVPGGSFQGNGHTLTKIGSSQLFFYDFGDTGVGDINVLEGQLGFQGPNINMGDPTKTCTVVGPAGSIRFFGASGLLLDKNLVLTNATTLDVNSGSNNFVGPITLWQTNTISVNAGNFQLALNGAITGSGGFIKAGNGPLYLNGAGTYAGPTLINAGSIILGTGGSIGNSSIINLAGGTTLDATLATGGLSLGAGQTLSGSGTLAGNVTAGTGASLSPGTAIDAGTLTFNNDLTMNGATNVIKLSGDPYTMGGGVNDFISVGGSLNLSGVSTIRINPIGILSSDAPYYVMQYGGAPPSLASLHAVSSSPRYSVSVIDPSTTPGYIMVNITGNPGALVWKGGVAANPNIWDNMTTNWLNLGTGLRDKYISGDNAIFNDTASVNSINVATAVIGVVSMSNNATAYTWTGNGLISAALDMEGMSSLRLAVSNVPAFSGITANSGTLIFDVQGVDSYTNDTAISDNGIGLGTIVKAGTNTLVLSGNNTAFYGAIAISNGILQYSNSAALGYYNSALYATNNGSLDLNHTKPDLKQIFIAGDGYNGQGAVVNSGGGFVNEGVHNLTLAGDASISASKRWDIYGGGGGGALNGNGYKLTKLGPNAIIVNSIGETHLGDIRVVEGRLGFQNVVSMGDPAKTLTVESNATVTLFNTTNNAATHGGEDKIMVLNGSTVIDSGGSSNNFDGPVTLVGTSNLFGLRTDLHLWNGINGGGDLIVAKSPVGNGKGTLWLDGNNTYTGTTTIDSNHKIVVGASSSLGASSQIQINSAATLDVSALASLNLGAGQTLLGAGTNIGNVVVGNGGTLMAGFPSANTYTLTINGNLTLQAGSTNVVVVNKTSTVANDTVAGLTSVTMAGTLIVTNVGTALDGGDAIQLFSASGGYNGMFDYIIPATPPGGGLAWDFSTLNTDGMLRVVRTGPPTTPTNIVFSAAAGEMTLFWPTSYIGWTLQGQTNAPGVGLTTNWYDVPGSTGTNEFIMPIDPANGSVFFRMILK